ncbi:glucosyltransferase, putative [Bodo saltans]|uniref:Glucosyltransferase, putative n=1 Tax=Bodo saltans TaxID=75058 RepID=A0A0S4IWM0_BODSA|nr:glucosyltransferase, putative [Bodo saltans]|eukprot:CUG05688.1 glucosyltransferase, putative [Bodo saltans]
MKRLSYLGCLFAATVALLVLPSLADKCQFPTYHPTRVNINETGVWLKTPYRPDGQDDYAYPAEWTNFNIKGIGYSPVPTGWALSDIPNGDFYGSAYSYIWGRDVPKMKEMGVNLIRVWNWNFMEGDHRAFLDLLYENGIYILIPFMMGTVNGQGQINYADLSAISTRQTVIEDWTVFVAAHTNHPAVFGFLVGNEVEKTVYQNQMQDFFSILNLMVNVGKNVELETPDLYDPERGHHYYHPISSPFAADSFEVFYTTYYDFLNIDFWSLQAYNDNPALEVTLQKFDFFLRSINVYKKPRKYVPMILTERGFSALTNNGSTVDGPIYNPEYQAIALNGTWELVQQYNFACRGICIMEWNDEWWKGGTISDVRQPGCPNPFPTVHANCASILGNANSTYSNITMVFEEWLGVWEQEDPTKQVVATNGISISILQDLITFIAPSKRYCIRPRAAFYTLQKLWNPDASTMAWEDINANTTGDWICGAPSGFANFYENPIVLVILPVAITFIVSIIVAVMKCGARTIITNEERVIRAGHIQDAAADSSRDAVTSYHYRALAEETQELLPQATMVAFSAAAIRQRSAMHARRGVLRTPLDPHIRHLTQLIFDKVDCMSMEGDEIKAKKYIDELVKNAFSKEVFCSSDLKERFGVVASASGAEVPAAPVKKEEGGATPPSMPADAKAVVKNDSGLSDGKSYNPNEDLTDVHEALHVVWFRYTEGYRLWLRHMKLPELKRLPSDKSESGPRMVEDLVILILLRCVCGTINHSPELMMRLYHDLLAKRGFESERRDLWGKILGKDGVMARFYKALDNSEPIMSLDDFNAFGLDPNMSIDKLAKEETVLTVKTFPERGGLHVLVTNYAWLIRLFLWLWMLGWYLQPVYAEKPLCLADAMRYLAIWDSLLYTTKSIGVATMIYGSPMKKQLIFSISMGALHFLVFIVFTATNLLANSQIIFDFSFNFPTIYVFFWVLGALSYEIYLFSQMAFGEHKMGGTFAAGHGRPRVVFGIAFAVGVFLSAVITFFLTQGGNKSDSGVSIARVDSSVIVPFIFLILFIAVVAPLLSRFTGRKMNDTRSVIELPVTAFWMLFTFVCSVINIYWLVPSVINLKFTICECQFEALGVSTDVCNWKNTFACDIAVFFTWVATFFVSFVVGYAAFILMSLMFGIGVAKTSSIGAVRNWEDVTMFGDSIIKFSTRHFTFAAQDFEVAKLMWNAFIDSMFKEHLLTAAERDMYMYQLIPKRTFQVLADYYVLKRNQDTEGQTTSETKVSELLTRVIKEIANGYSDTLSTIKQILIPSQVGAQSGGSGENSLTEAELQERKVLYHRLCMALTIDDTVAFTIMARRTQAAAQTILAEATRKSDPVPVGANLVHFLNAILDPSTEGYDKVPGFIKQVYLKADIVDFDVPPRNTEAIRRIVHFLWSTECAKVDSKRREKAQGDKDLETQMIMRQFHRVATMPSCTTIIPYYNENVVYTWRELTEAFDKGQPRISFLEYLACQFPDEWENLAHNETWREGLKNFDRGCTGSMCRCGPLFLEYLLRSRNISEEQKWRISMFATFRGQTLGRTLRGLESLRHGMKIMAFLEERHTFEAEWETKSAKEKKLIPGGEVEESLRHKFCLAQCQQLVDSKYQVIVAAQVYTPTHLREKNGVKGEQLLRDQQLDRLQREGLKAFTFDIVCNDDPAHTSYFIPYNAPDAVFSIKRPGLLRVSKKFPTEGKPENQLHAVPFAFGEVLNTFDMNQDDNLEMGYKHPLLVSIFWNPMPKAFVSTNNNELLYTPKYRIVGFAEHTYTRPLSLVGELMGAAEFCFVTITQRVLSRPLGVRAHYGHPDYVDGYWARTRGGMSKASHVVNVNEDIFCGYEMLSRGQKITFVEWMQAQKGRESAFLPAFVFESKLAGGAGQQVRSRDVYFLNRRLDIFSRMSVAFGTLGFYIVNFLMGASVHYFIWAIVLFRVSNTTFHQLGIMQAKIAVAWVFQLGYVLAVPLFIENCVEHGLITGAWMFIRTIVPSVFFFVFHLQTKFYYFLESIIRGKAEYQATGRGFVLDRISLVTVYRSYADSHIHEALLYLIMLLVYRYVSTESTFSYLMRCMTIMFIVISWFCAPIFFQPYPTTHQLDIDWSQAKLWLGMPCRPLNDTTRLEVNANEANTSWSAWFALNQIKNWTNEEGAYSFGHIFALTFIRIIMQYLPWFTMFLLYVSMDTMYLVIAIFLGQVLHYILVARIDPSQHHFLSVIELIVLGVAVPCTLFFYFTLTTVKFADILFGACIYIVVIGFIVDTAVLFSRLRYKIKFRGGEEKVFYRQRVAVALAVVPYKQINAVICMFILYSVTYVCCFFKSSITSINYSSAAAFAWERVHILPREISVITAEPIERKK